MTRDLDDAHNVNSELKSCISELETQLLQVTTQREQPFSSTPHRYTQSLHDEILGQESLRNSGSPVSPLRFSGTDYDATPPQEEEISRTVQKELQVSPAMESLAKLVDETVSLLTC